MEKEKKKKAAKTAAIVLGSAAVGAGLGVLFAPKKGSETRKDLSNKLKSLVEKAKTLKKTDVKEYVLKKAKNIEKALVSLEKEKTLKTAQAKAKKLEKDAKDLVEYVASKGEDALVDLANGVYSNVEATTKSIIKKLEK